MTGKTSSIAPPAAREPQRRRTAAGGGVNEPFGQLRDIFTGACDEGGPLRECRARTAPVAFPASSWSRQSRLDHIPSCICSLRFHRSAGLLASEGFRSRHPPLSTRGTRIPTSPRRCVTPRRLPSVRRLYLPPWPPGDPRKISRHHQCLTYPRGYSARRWTFASPSVARCSRPSTCRGHSPPITASRYVMQCWRGWGGTVAGFQRPEAIGRGLRRSCCRRGSRWRPPTGYTSFWFYAARVARGGKPSAATSGATFSELRPAPALKVPAKGKSRWRLPGAQLKESNGLVSKQ